MKRLLWLPILACAVLVGAMLVRRPQPGSAGSVASPRSAGETRFHEHVAPILIRRCSECHRPGQAAPFSLLTYAEVRKRGRQIADVVSARIMPPWLPAPGGLRFENDRSLNDEEIRTITEWVEGGMKEGNPGSAPQIPDWPDGWQLGRPDMIAPMTESFTVPADGPDVYRNFVVPVPTQKDQFVTAVQFRPDNPRVIHHATLQVDETHSCRALDDRDEGVGFSGIMVAGRAHLPEGFFVGWAPGKAPYRVPDDMGWLLPAGSDLVLQLHLRPSGKPEPIRVSLGLFFASRPPTRFPVSLVVREKRLDMPAGEPAYRVRQQYQLPVDLQVLGIYPHAHYLGRTMRVYARSPGGDATPLELLRINNWNFNWQDEFRYQKPFRLPAGTIIEMDYTFDNSASNAHNPHQPPRRVAYGRNADDEMAELLVQVLPNSPAERDALRQDLARNALEHEVARHQARVETDPGDVRALSELGGVLRQLGRIEEAIPVLKRAAESDPASADLRFLLGDCLARTGRTIEAMDAFEQSLKIQPEGIRALNSLARLLAAPGAGQRRDPGRAVALASRAVALSPQPDPGLLETLMIAHAEAGNMDAARKVGQNAIDLAERAGASEFARRVEELLEAYRMRARNAEW